MAKRKLHAQLVAAVGGSIAQFGELFQGQIEDRSGRLRRCLLSLPCPSLYSQAVFHPKVCGAVTVTPSHKQKALNAAVLALNRLGTPGAGGVLEIRSNIPEAKGCGSSTADCIAAIRAVANAFDAALSPDDIARLVVAAETASGSFMYRQALLFAHREGEVIETFQGNLPALEVLGIDAQPGGRVETLTHPLPDYSERDIRAFHAIAAALRRAVREHDLELLGQAASASAHINQRFLPQPLFLEIQAIAKGAGALGVGTAHSGTVMAMLLDPALPNLERQMDSTQTRLSQLGIEKWMRFRTDQPVALTSCYRSKTPRSSCGA